MPTKLETLLDRTRDAVVAGDLATLSGLGPEVEAVVDSLPQLDSQGVRTLQAKAERNSVLLRAAMRGLRAAKLRLDEISGGQALTTYDSQGRKAVVAALGSKTPRRI